jgi:hypothetical protein
VVVSQAGMTVDVKMDDPRMPGMSALPIQVGIPGATVSLAPGARMLVAFENGDPAKPIALSWDAGAHALRLSLPADLVELGGQGLNPATTGVVNGEAIDSFSGLQMWMLGNASHVVMAKKT